MSIRQASRCLDDNDAMMKFGVGSHRNRRSCSRCAWSAFSLSDSSGRASSAMRSSWACRWRDSCLAARCSVSSCVARAVIVTFSRPLLLVGVGAAAEDMPREDERLLRVVGGTPSSCSRQPQPISDQISCLIDPRDGRRTGPSDEAPPEALPPRMLAFSSSNAAVELPAAVVLAAAAAGLATGAGSRAGVGVGVVAERVRVVTGGRELSSRSNSSAAALCSQHQERSTTRRAEQQQSDKTMKMASIMMSQR